MNDFTMTDKMTTAVLRKMHETIGVKFGGVKKSCNSPNWFLKRTWTKSQADEFEVWLTKYLQKELKYSAKFADITSKMFILCYGWKNAPDA